MESFTCVQDFEDSALKLLPTPVRDYYKSGAGGEVTLQWNIKAFKQFRIRPRVLRNASKVDMRTRVLGEEVSMPLGVAPTAMQRMAHPDGECANAKAAEKSGTIFIQSTISTSSIEEIAASAPKAIKWFQLYVSSNRDITLNLIRRIERAGFKAVVLTVDTPFFGKRRADVRNKFTLPSHLKLANFNGDLATSINTNRNDGAFKELFASLIDDSLEWRDVHWLRSITKLPIVLKGILTGEDAILAMEHGASAVIVSNHGARQIDGTAATIEALSEVVSAVEGRIEVYLDGGIRTGTDVFKALALGAKMVFFGRPMLWGLTHAGEKGATAILELMREEIREALALAGCSTLEEVTKELITHESVYSRL
ncbi:hydroxyacid oxidase 1 [Fopius arisanus]|uniref:(S)-2-hydroxy-acid oxidase n=1 Tax=Fopius arisanus TaxID=64838 RepID=A0A9R1T867_9HYME|nr:PREDICTED: hydroxyacid oxidase 1 [Fopius arisanus]